MTEVDSESCLWKDIQTSEHLGKSSQKKLPIQRLHLISPCHLLIPHLCYKTMCEGGERPLQRGKNELVVAEDAVSVPSLTDQPPLSGCDHIKPVTCHSITEIAEAHHWCL